MKLGHAAIVVVLGVFAGVGLGIGCGARPTPVAQPEEPPPLPPTSGTPIGHLIDGAGELKLNDDQIGKLKAISDELADRLAAGDARMRPDLAAASQGEKNQRGLGFHAAGAREDGEGSMSGGNETFPGATGSGGQGGQIIIPADVVNEVYRQRARDVRDAIRRALALLDAEQQVIARKLLIDEEPGAAKLEDPKLGQPLPREP
jgi:hypothetical protein